MKNNRSPRRNRSSKRYCHVCGNEKEPYTVIINKDILAIERFHTAREKGDICKRCNDFHAMTGELRQPSQKEFMIAKKSSEFANLMFKYWQSFGELDDSSNSIEWKGIVYIERWCRQHLMEE